MTALEWIGFAIFAALMLPMIGWLFRGIFRIWLKRLQEWWKAQQYSE